MKTKNMTYAGSGVNYDALDPFKIAAQHAALLTAGNIANFSNGRFKEFSGSRGGSAYLIETPDGFIALTEEGLGTKNLVGDIMYKLTGKSYDDRVAQCTVAMIVNDLITSGARVLSVAMHSAVGNSDWFKNEYRSQNLIEGWKRACDLARCTWGCGETPTLKGLIYPETMVLSGSAIGMITPKERRIVGNIQDGDVIIIIESSGIHANGLTLARMIAERKDRLGRKIANTFLPNRFPTHALPEGYLTLLSDGRTYGETLLDPTYIYVGIIEDCFDAGISIHAAEPITGHGWRKIMRSPLPFTYTIKHLPRQLPIFDFIQQHGPVDNREAYSNFNMGAGYVLFVDQKDAAAVTNVARSLGFVPLIAGFVERGEKKVIIEPRDLVLAGDTLAIRS